MLIRWGLVGLVIMFLAAMYYVFSGERNLPPPLTLEVRQDLLEDDVVIFSWSGRVDRPMAAQVWKAFNQWKDRASRIVIELDSPGGLVSEGNKVIDIINKIEKTHAVWTYVGPDGECLSMCVPIYLQGRMRVASASSQWLFHDARAYDPHTGTEIIMYAHEKSQSEFEFFNRYIDRSDVNPAWRDKLKANMRAGDVWKTGQELKDERSNIVMVLED